MADATREEVQTLYQALLGRPPESEDVIASRLGRPLIEVALEIAGSEEHNSGVRAEVEFALKLLGSHHLDQFRAVQAGSKSQMRQDIFVLSTLGFKRDGFFVDFGATDGVHWNNSYLMETEFGWRGICAEPARCWHERLSANRTARIVKKCVWTKSGELLDFDETAAPEISTISSFAGFDYMSDHRKIKKTYKVETVSLNDMLSDSDAPHLMDYLSIDTEGSELEILKGLDHERYSFRVITCEHNYTSLREEIIEFLETKGYVRRFPELSLYDDWFVKPSLL